MTAAWFPALGLAAEMIVLLDPPAVPLAVISQMLDDPIERPYDDLAEAMAAMGALYPTWPYGDILAKAESLTQFDVAAVRAVLTQNGDWDGGLAALSDPAAAGARVRLVRGDDAGGGMIPEAAAAAFRDLLGAENVITIPGGSHSPMRQKPEATAAALLRALEP
jgi:pimeloyl-ACP methyl ester carboxylesterase